MADHRQALEALYKVPLANFVAERDRLAAELRAAGDEEGARQLTRRRRPTTSAWTVNQLYWHARDAFDPLLAAAARMRKGDLGETSAYREALGELRKRAAAILRDAAHAGTEATLRRVTGTLAAVAAAGGFDPDPPGALATDRDPPGFDAVDAPASPPAHQSHRGSSRRHATVARTAVPERVRLAAAARAEDRAEREARKVERHRLQKALADAQATLRARERASSLLQKELHASEKAVEDAREVVRDLERQVEVLDDD
jgi:hypothetical protein